MMSRGEWRKQRKWEFCVVARCGRSWPIAREHYRVPHHGCFFGERHRTRPSASALDFQNAWWLGDPVGGGPGRVVTSPSSPRRPTIPSPPLVPPCPRDSESSMFPGSGPLASLGLSHLLAPRVPLLPRLESPFHPDFEKVSGLCQINFVLSSFLLPPGSLPFPPPPQFLFSCIRLPLKPASPQSRPNPMRVPPGVDACANPSQDPY